MPQSLFYINELVLNFTCAERFSRPSVEQPRQRLHWATKKIFLRVAKLVRSNLGYIRCAESENEVIFIRLALGFEIFKI